MLRARPKGVAGEGGGLGVAFRPVEIFGELLAAKVPGIYALLNYLFAHPYFPLLMHLFERYEVGVFRRLLERGSVVIDIGASIGFYSLAAAPILGDTGRIYAFEPEPRNYRRLVRNIRILGYGNITPLPKAVSDRSGRVTFYPDRADPTLSSLSAGNIRVKSEAIEVEAVALDDFFRGKPDERRKIRMIKMDVQGAEGRVLQGARSILTESGRLTILMEIWLHGLRQAGTDPRGLLEEIEGLGFQIFLLDRDYRRMVQVTPSWILDYCTKVEKSPFPGKGVNLILRKGQLL